MEKNEGVMTRDEWRSHPAPFAHVVICARIEAKRDQIDKLLELAPSRIRVKYSYLREYTLTPGNYFDKIDELDLNIAKLTTEIKGA